ncbi:MAG TPA: trypsin-like peptidase domain-containing protein, partial [Phycisphaerae bacterium]|nr:trypsin-like peptidase domain-containing protein [Phycisphaerae bacterium]
MKTLLLTALLGWLALTGAARPAPPEVETADRATAFNYDAARRDEQLRIETIARVAPAVVCIYDRRFRGGGSGVIMHPDGYGLTNFHVVADMLDTGAGLAGLPDGKLYELRVLGLDPTGDVAMFRLTGRDRFDFAELGDSDTVDVGDVALAMGNPFVLAEDHTPTVTMGIVTGTHRYQWGRGNALVYSDCIQTDAPINPGNSGGPLFDVHGRVIGINGRISVASGVRGRYNVGLAYAISINQIKRFIPALRRGHVVRHGTLQATVNGDLIFNELIEDGPAWKVGIRPGDRLLRFGGRRVTSDNHFASLLGTYPEHWPVPISFEHHGEPRHAVAQLEPLSIEQDVPLKIDPEGERHPERWVVEHWLSTAGGDLFPGDGWARSLWSSLRTSPTPAEGDFDHAIDTVTARTVKLYGLGAGLQEGYGSGILVSPGGQVLTVLSILVDARNLRAVTADGTVYPASVVHRDPDRQLVLLQLEQPDTLGQEALALPCFRDGSSHHLRPGDWVVAAGNAFKVADGAEPVSVAHGVFSGRINLDARRRTQDYPFHEQVLAIDAVTSNPGAPGGPLVDLDGRWVGMVGRVVVSNLTNTQFNHAVPVELCAEFLREARDPSRSPTAEQPRRHDRDVSVDPGIKLFEMSYRKKLVYVESVRPSSPAARAGLRPDDLIVRANGRNVPDVAAFQRVLEQLKPGDGIELVVVRDDQLHNLNVTLDPTAASGTPDARGEPSRAFEGDDAARRFTMPAAGCDSAGSAQHANQRLFHAAADAVAPCVVRIETVGGAQPLSGDVQPSERSPFRDDPGSDFRLADGPTTGLIYSSDGHILTSSFNFVRDPQIITVTL